MFLEEHSQKCSKFLFSLRGRYSLDIYKANFVQLSITLSGVFFFEPKFFSLSIYILQVSHRDRKRPSLFQPLAQAPLLYQAGLFNLPNCPGYLLLHHFLMMQIHAYHSCMLKKRQYVFFLNLYSINSGTWKLGPSDTPLPRCPLRKSLKGKGLQQLFVSFYQVNAKDSCLNFLSKSFAWTED